MIINKAVTQAIIIRYKEDVTALRAALLAEGIDNVSTVSRDYSEEELTYSSQSRCLLGHYDAWQLAKKSDGLTLVLEADFVPCIGFGEQKVPYSKDKLGKAWGWLYSCAQRVYEFDGEFIRGHSSTAVAYVLDGKAAEKIDGFVEQEFSENPPQGYSPWDTYIRIYAQQNGVSMYLPFRSYGEHGGIPNPEHKRFAINPNHQADILIGPLHFQPLYADGSALRYLLIRGKAYTRAWARLFCLRYVEAAILKSGSMSFAYKFRLCLMAGKRLLPFIRSRELLTSDSEISQSIVR